MNLTRVSLLVLTLGFVGCQRAKDEAEPPSARVEGGKVTFPPGSPQPAAIATQPARPAEAGVVRLTGRAVWDEDVTVRIFSSLGGRVTRLIAPVGQSVAKDGPLALIASPDFGQVQADAAKAALDLRLAQQTVERLRDLAGYGAAAQKDLRAAEIDLARAQGESERVTRRLELYDGAEHSATQEFTLKSPLAGVVVEKNINPGQQVGPDQIAANAPPLFVVTDPTRLWVVLDATEQSLPFLKTGATVTVRSPSFAADAFTARVENIADAVDPNSRTIKVRCAMENPGRTLKAGMFVNAELSVTAPEGVEIPAAAVYLKGDRHFVFVQEAAGTYRKREVTVGVDRGGWVLVGSGLAAGEPVVRDGALMLEQILSDKGGQ